MSCTQPDKQKVELSAVPVPSDISGAQGSGRRRLFISDNPESINDSVPFVNHMATVWHDTVKDSNSVSYRVFLWHYNRLDIPVRAAVTVSNDGVADSANLIQISKVSVQEVLHTENFLAAGLCMAKALIGGTWNIRPPVDKSVQGGDIGIVYEMQMNPNTLSGAVVEFTVKQKKKRKRALQFMVRSVLANHDCAELRTHREPPVTPNSPHPRGSWDFADIRGNSISFDVRQGEQSVSIMGKGNDFLYKAALSYDPEHAFDNKGQYGAKYKVSVRLINRTHKAKQVAVYLNPRGGAFAGAVKIKGVTYGVPIVKAPNEACELMNVTVRAHSVLNIPLEIAIAGAASSPIAILCRTLN
ncbi:hypothetical protein LQV63_14900 [Paenibacillus profundus]|uniref:Uncharacterized protein n=1 Tax=Paenibacillus profundus TaxID=1173085 RepID=A0ABS8YK29_9BACL|nr:hypothetical protein [Paenibacillus profundus]MCE5170602.1 hypothetical protein [Paenibacillus profundus]